jgi:thioredoxin
LAFADMNIDVARAILIADEEDAKEEEEEQQEQMARLQAEQQEEEKRATLREEAQQRKYQEAQMKTVNVDADFDPTKPIASSSVTTTAAAAMAPPQGAPKPAKKDDVVFQGTAKNIQEVVLESPVPVLLDVYADWCGPCKALTPALEQMAIKAGGMFRLVKLNTDEERNISASLEVTSLPTVFGIRDGRIVHSFRGMPRDEEFMRNFMMGLLTGGDFNPAPTKEERQKYVELSNKLIKIAGSSGFSFSQRERLQVLTNNKLDELVGVRGDMSDAEETAKVVRSLLSNVIRDPFEEKFRKVNLENKVISERVGAFAPAISILKAVGFKEVEHSATNALILGKGKKIVNVAPLVVARDTIDKWIDVNRRAIAAALRKKQDEEARQKLLEQAEEVESDDEEEDDSRQLDPDICNLKIRLEGKKKIHDVQLNANDTLQSIIESLPMNIPQGEEVTITCTARRLIVKSTDEKAMGRSLRECKLLPTASIVIKVGEGVDRTDNTVSLKERAAARKVKKKGEHTMQSTGIYAKDDNAKGELIDGGGGVWYEHDVSSDDEAEAKDDTDAKDASSTKDEDGDN